MYRIYTGNFSRRVSISREKLVRDLTLLKILLFCMLSTNTNFMVTDTTRALSLLLQWCQSGRSLIS